MGRKPSGGRSTRNTCDKLWRDLIKDRAGWKCQACGYQGRKGDRTIEAAHIIPRNRAATRTDERNGLALCNSLANGCHRRFDDPSEPFFRTDLIERLDLRETVADLFEKAEDYTRSRVGVFDWKSELARLKELDR